MWEHSVGIDIKAADTELVGYFTSAVDVSGQSYESGGGSAKDVEAALVECHHRRELAFWERVHETFRKLPPPTARMLADVYLPYGEPDLRGIKLRPSWGGGTFVRIASSSPHAVMRFRHRYPTLPTLPEIVGGWLREQAGRADHALFQTICDECEARRAEGLQLYAELMVTRQLERRDRENAILKGVM